MAEQLETILAWLDDVRDDLESATDGPWRAALLDGVECEDGSSSYRAGIYPDHVGALPIILTNGVDRQDATLIASAPDRLDRMERALRSVLAEHVPEPHEIAPGEEMYFCADCGNGWMDDGCPGVRAITAALLGEAGA